MYQSENTILPLFSLLLLLFTAAAVDILVSNNSGKGSGIAIRSLAGAPAPQPSCVVTVDGKTYDLRKLGNSNALFHFASHDLGSRGSSFSFSACGRVEPDKSAGFASCAAAPPSAALQHTEGDCASLGAPETRKLQANARGLLLQFNGGYRCDSTSLKTASIVIQIDCTDVSKPVVVRWGGGDAPCSFAALIGARAGCAAEVIAPAQQVKASKNNALYRKADNQVLPLVVATSGMWASADVVLNELWMFSDVVFRASQRALVPVNVDLPKEEALASADVIFMSIFEERDSLNSLTQRFKTSAVTVFFGSENTDGSPYDNQLVGNAAISFGHRREAPTPLLQGAHEGSAYLRLPWWLPYTVRRETGGCVLPPLLFETMNPLAWLARPGFTAFLSRHTAYPRQLLFDLVMTLGRVDAPGKAFHNMEWPSELPNSHLNGKIEFLRRYRFTICPENSRTRGAGGYNTEKLAQAHFAGAVPIYWGDAIDTEVFNQARVIVFNDTNAAEVLNTMRMLQEDKEFRSAWFARPVLAPTAGAWLEAWCQNASAIFRTALSELRQKQN